MQQSEQVAYRQACAQGRQKLTPKKVTVVIAQGFVEHCASTNLEWKQYSRVTDAAT